MSCPSRSSSLDAVLIVFGWCRSRSDLVEQLVGDVCQYHGYTPYLAEKLFDLFGVDEVRLLRTPSVLLELNLNDHRRLSNSSTPPIPLVPSLFASTLSRLADVTSPRRSLTAESTSSLSREGGAKSVSRSSPVEESPSVRSLPLSLSILL